ncbi:MAG: hypothetical protein EB078_04250 [Proteobacteria bacterium]|nr:hypothetical protein [Pseudomonadota bacterium]
MMQPRTIKYSQRLGDVLRCLPACKYLADQGHEVFFDCFDQYHGVFEMTSYVKAGHRQGLVIDLEIWPTKYEEYRKSRKPWHDFVYSHHSINGADRTNIILDKLDKSPAGGLPAEFNLIAPFGISQGDRRNPVEIIQDAIGEFGRDNTIILCPQDSIQIHGIRTYTAPTIADMAKAIRDAREFVCINSSPAVIASAVRRGKETRVYGQRGEFAQDNIHHFDGLIIV